MNELHELPRPLRELNETPGVDGKEIFSSELTRQEADEKVAALIEERRTVGESEKPALDIGDGKIAELAYRKRRADEALSKWNSLDKELKALKSKRNYERDPAKKSALDKKISAKQSEVDSAKRDYENKKSAYQSYARNL